MLNTLTSTPSVTNRSAYGFIPTYEIAGEFAHPVAKVVEGATQWIGHPHTKTLTLGELDHHDIPWLTSQLALSQQHAEQAFNPGTTVDSFAPPHPEATEITRLAHDGYVGATLEQALAVVSNPESRQQVQALYDDENKTLWGLMISHLEPVVQEATQATEVATHAVTQWVDKLVKTTNFNGIAPLMLGVTQQPTAQKVLVVAPNPVHPAATKVLSSLGFAFDAIPTDTFAVPAQALKETLAQRNAGISVTPVVHEGEPFDLSALGVKIQPRTLELPALPEATPVEAPVA